jgi:hypothetical protein
VPCPGLRATIQLLPMDVEAHVSTTARTRCDRLLQRVSQARVEVAGQVIGRIDRGLLVLVCAEPADTEATPAAWWTRC